MSDKQLTSQPPLVPSGLFCSRQPVFKTSVSLRLFQGLLGAALVLVLGGCNTVSETGRRFGDNTSRTGQAQDIEDTWG